MVQMVIPWIIGETLVTYQCWGCCVSKFGVSYLDKVNPNFLDTRVSQRSFGIPRGYFAQLYQNGPLLLLGGVLLVLWGQSRTVGSITEVLRLELMKRN